MCKTREAHEGSSCFKEQLGGLRCCATGSAGVKKRGGQLLFRAHYKERRVWRLRDERKGMTSFLTWSMFRLRVARGAGGVEVRLGIMRASPSSQRKNIVSTRRDGRFQRRVTHAVVGGGSSNAVGVEFPTPMVNAISGERERCAVERTSCSVERFACTWRKSGQAFQHVLNTKTYTNPCATITRVVL